MADDSQQDTARMDARKSDQIADYMQAPPPPIIDPTLDERVAARLGMLPQQVAIIRSEWERTPNAAVIKMFLTVKLEILLSEPMGKLKRCTPDQLKELQGQISGLELGQSVVSSAIVT